MPDERGVHADAARAREAALAGRLRVTAAADGALTAAVRDARSAARRAARRLDAIGAQIDAAVAGQSSFGLDTPAGTRRFSGFLAAQARDIEQVITDTAVDDQTRAALLQALGGRYRADTPAGPGIQAVDNRTRNDDPQRRQNQIDAFVAVFGREPVSRTDWTTAAALDRHTYDPDYQGSDSEIQVARINPVPGQGVVRVGQWIAQREVVSSPPWQRDLGNNRGTDAHFDPEATKVTTYIDYENGIVILRQNPSTRQRRDGSAGEVRLGVPHGSVVQADDGSVRIRYSAANPFAPAEFADTTSASPISHAWTVNGDLVFNPTAGGVVVGGTRTDYPSMEVYQDLPNGNTRTVLIDPARSGRSIGPLLNLPRHHDVGIGGIAFAPFDSGGWDPTAQVRIPLPATDFAPITVTPPDVAPSGFGVRLPA